MSSTLTLSGDYSDADLDSLCHELRQLHGSSPDRPHPRLDLRDLNALEPTPLAVLLASISGLHTSRSTDPLRDFVAPEGVDAAGCLSVPVLRRLMREGVGHWQEDGGDEPVVIGSEVFVGPAGIDKVTGVLQAKLTLYTNWSASSVRAFSTMAFELAENVMQHSTAPHGVVVVQIRPVENRVSLAIADNGIGVRDSLAKNPDYGDIDDDLTAIVASMGAGATGEPGTGGGMGLYFARLLVRDNDGTFLIRSGEACREESEEVSDSTQLPHLQGTLISIETRTDKPLDYGRIEESLRLPSGIPDRSS